MHLAMLIGTHLLKVTFNARPLTWTQLQVHMVLRPASVNSHKQALDASSST